MAYYDFVWYCNAGDQSTTGYYAVAKWAATTAVVASALRRQLTAPAVNSERVFVCIVAGTTGSTEPTWVLTRGAKTTDGTVTWMECTGIAAVNGDKTNTVNWTAAKAIGTPSLGTIIQRNNGASYQICTTAGTLGAAEPAFSDTAGVTTTETSATTVWTSLGVVGNFTGGQAPHARLQNVTGTNWYTWGNTIYVGDNHAESQTTTITIAPPASNASITGKVICHNHSGSYPPASSNLATTATISATGGGTITFNPQGPMYYYGLTFKAGAGGASTGAMITLVSGASTQYFDGCSLQLLSTGSGALIVVGNGSTASAYIFNNTTVYFGHTADYISILISQLTWQNTGQILAASSSIPAALFSMTNAFIGIMNVILEALDLSQLTGTLYSTPNAAISAKAIFTIKDCKLNASMTFATPALVGCVFQNVRSDSSATAYKSARYAYEGTETTETSITRVGGAADPTGQAQSRKIVTTANSQWLMPFKAEPYAIWNPTSAANVTVTVYGTINAGALPNNDDIWMEVEYLGSSATPLGTIVNTTKANLLAANAAVASDGSSWNNATGIAYTTWNPSDKSANSTLSNGNLTAVAGSGSGGLGGVRGIVGFSSGKYYFEVTTTVCISSSLGLALSTNTLFGNTTGAVGVNAGGSVQVNGSNVGTVSLPSLGGGVILGIAVDLTAGLIWFRVGASGSWNATSGTANNPATGTGGISISAIAGVLFPWITTANAGETFTANFGATAFNGAVPSGFTAGWGASWSPFKLVATLSSPQPGLAGLIYVRPSIAKPSTTYYLDPNPVLS